ncbi:transposase [Rhizobium mesoamericanum]|uniref:helix-turn-helix domain-containing protein n=1 Tax=Rhizobium mesoamericanum TaxID=1079800 RepID=UPI00278A4643|nr:transposase [Rhizobium mesoamericanum]MDQ0560220.1 transposase [Rhizobium mesoamericanum]
MSKHDEAFKRSVVEFYQKGERGSREVDRHFGVDHATVRKWAASYEGHGPAGLAKKFSHYNAAFKLSVLQRMWEDGLSYRQTAAL